MLSTYFVIQSIDLVGCYVIIYIISYVSWILLFVCAKFNFAADPEAAYIVLNRFFCPTYIATWEFCCENKLPWVRPQVLVIYLFRLSIGPALTSEQMGGNETRRGGHF